MFALLGHCLLVQLQQTHGVIRDYMAQLLSRGGDSQLSSWPAPILESQCPTDQQHGLCPCSLFCSDRCWRLAAFPANRQLQRDEDLDASQKASSCKAWKDLEDAKVLNPFCVFTVLKLPQAALNYAGCQ